MAEYDLLDEYVDVTNKITEIQNILDKHRENVKKKILAIDDDADREKIIRRFENKMNEIHNSELITNTYKSLKQRQSEIRNILLPKNNISNDNDHNTNILSVIDNIRRMIE